MLLSSIRRSTSKTAANIVEVIVPSTLLCQGTMSRDRIINTPSFILKISCFLPSSHSVRECFRKAVPKSHSSFNHFETKHINVTFLSSQKILYFSVALLFAAFKHNFNIYIQNVHIYIFILHICCICIYIYYTDILYLLVLSVLMS